MYESKLRYDECRIKECWLPERRFVSYSDQEHALEWICEQLENIKRCSMFDDRRDSIPDIKFQTSFYDASMLEAASSDSEQFRASNYLYKHSVYLVNTCKQENGSHERTTCPVLPTTNVPDGKTNAAFSW